MQDDSVARMQKHRPHPCILATGITGRYDEEARAYVLSVDKSRASLTLHLDANGGVASMVGFSGNTDSHDLRGLFEDLTGANVLHSDFKPGEKLAPQADPQCMQLATERDAEEIKQANLAAPDIISVICGMPLADVVTPHGRAYFGSRLTYAGYGISGMMSVGTEGGEHWFGVDNIPNPGDVEHLRLVWDRSGEITFATNNSKRPLSVECLSHLCGIGIIQPALLELLGISLKTAYKIAEAGQARQAAIGKRLVRDSIASLPVCPQNVAKNPMHVRQGHAAFIVPGGKVDALSTDRASCCCILIAVEKAPDMKVTHIGMAHVDPVGVQGPDALDTFFALLKTHDSSSTEVHIISGSFLTASNVHAAAERAKARILFCAANLPCITPHGAVVNDKGEVFRDTTLTMQRLSDGASNLDNQRGQRIGGLSLEQLEMQDKLQFTHY